MKLSLAPLALLLAMAPAASGQFIVHTGDDLQNIVDSAPSGTVIEIQSSAFFDVALVFVGSNAKNLTLRAGAGYKPILWNASSPPITVYREDMKLIFEGLTLDNGLLTGTPTSFDAPGSGSLGDLAEVTFVDCTLDGRATIGGTGSAALDIKFQDCTIDGALEITGTGNYILDLELTNTVMDSISSNTNSSVSLDAVVHDCEILGPVELEGDGIDGTWEVRRSIIRGPVVCEAPDTTGSFYCVFESCLIGDPAGSVAGLGFTNMKFTGGDACYVDLYHCTITGFDEGIEVSSDANVDGCLIYGNGDDITSASDTGVFNYCLIEDGSFTSAGSNLSGPVHTTSSGALQFGSQGIDAGMTSYFLLSPTDLYGNTRVQDHDLDGNARANVGAIERIDGADASATPFNGTGINLPAMTSTLPILGTLVNVTIAGDAATLLSILAIDAPSPVPFAIPGWQGEVLLAASPALLLNVSFGTHVLPIPLDASLVGLGLSAQGARVDLVTGSPKVLLCNRIDYVFGI